MQTHALDWSPRWYLWDGGFLAIGRNTGRIPVHSHHAIQISIAIDGTLQVGDAWGGWQECAGFIVKPDAPHALAGTDVDGALLFVEPEAYEGRWLRSSLTHDITIVPEARLETCATALRTFAERPLESMDVGDVVRHCVRSLSPGAPPARKVDPRIEQVLHVIRNADDLRISLDDVAARVFLSPSRLAHLFTHHVGLPFRRYLLWRKLARALLDIGRGASLTAAAHSAGFADAAHLTRTFNQMFGIPPSVMMRGEFFDIDSPFDAAAAR
jgi:AraC family transcriptional regulator